VLDVVPAGVATLGADLRIRSANRRLGAIVGEPPEALVGRSFELLLSTPARLLFQTHVYPALLADGRVEEVFLVLGDSGDRGVPVLLNAEKLDGPEAGYAVAVVRIRARSKWEEELLATTRALEREQAASRKLAEDLATAARDLDRRQAEEERNRRFRDAFVGVVSHELRTPITTIFGMSHLLRERHGAMDGDAVKEALDDIEAEADRLRRLTEDLLVLSRAEGGRLEIAAEPLVLGHLLRSAVREEASRAEGHRFELEVESHLPLVVGESTYVEQVLRNFLTNAVKYSPAGTRIRIDASTAAGGAAVRVTDEGRGLGDGPTDHLWELFYRTKDAIRQASGAGIGLFVAKQLIQAMGGRVWAVPSPTGGAEFGFWLPAVAALDEG
jgi:signal transduction histidine kinase